MRLTLRLFIYFIIRCCQPCRCESGLKKGEYKTNDTTLPAPHLVKIKLRDRAHLNRIFFKIYTLYCQRNTMIFFLLLCAPVVYTKFRYYTRRNLSLIYFAEHLKPIVGSHEARYWMIFFCVFCNTFCLFMSAIYAFLMGGLESCWLCCDTNMFWIFCKLRGWPIL